MAKTFNIKCEDENVAGALNEFFVTFRSEIENFMNQYFAKKALGKIESSILFDGGKITVEKYKAEKGLVIVVNDLGSADLVPHSEVRIGRLYLSIVNGVPTIFEKSEGKVDSPISKISDIASFEKEAPRAQTEFDARRKAAEKIGEEKGSNKVEKEAVGE